MSCTIELKDVTILKTSVGVFEDLYDGFNDIIAEKNLHLDKEFELFVEKLDIACLTLGGVCIDIAVIFKSSSNINLLITLLEETIPKIKHELKDWALEGLWKFHAELIKYQEELEAQGK